MWLMDGGGLWLTDGGRGGRKWWEVVGAVSLILKLINKFVNEIYKNHLFIFLPACEFFSSSISPYDFYLFNFFIIFSV